RPGGAMDPAPITVAHQSRQIAGVVEMGMGEHDVGDAPRRDGEGGPVPEAELLQPLEQAAIHEYPGRIEGQEMARAGHGPGSTQELQRQRHPTSDESLDAMSFLSRRRGSRQLHQPAASTPLVFYPAPGLK